MLFNSIEFIIFFVVVLASITIIKQKNYQHLILLFSSYFFFYFSSNYLITLLIISTLLDFYLGSAIWKTSSQFRKKIFLVASLAGNLCLLGFFKYADFSIEQINYAFNHFNLEPIPFLNLVLPIGISFYTFQTISYTIDIYRGKLEPSKSLSEFALFVSFFPQLVAGPIVRAKDFLPQLREKLSSSNGKSLRQIVIKQSNLKFGISLMAIGFFKKMFFADNLAPFVDEVFSYPIGLDSFAIFLGTLAFGIQIYCDFSGYSDIAIGAALILGFNIPKNFNFPYFATSPSDFWHRWHISLSTWLRDYFYIPLGGNKKSEKRTYLNLVTVMFFGGLWHGASWNFVIWGLLHGLYLIIHRVITKKIPFLNNNAFFKTRLGKIISISIVQYFVFLAWIPFRVENTDHMLYSIQKFILFDINFVQVLPYVMSHKWPIMFLVGFLVLHFITYKKPNFVEIISNLNLKWWTLLLTSFLILIIFTFNGDPQDFIYFRF